jgi:hypothetical protein
LNGLTTPTTTISFTVVTNPTFSGILPPSIEYDEAPSNGVSIPGADLTADGQSTATEVVMVDGSTINSPADYSLNSSSLTLTAAYVNSLLSGSHTISLSVSLNSTAAPVISQRLVIAGNPAISSVIPATFEAGAVPSSGVVASGAHFAPAGVPGVVDTITVGGTTLPSNDYAITDTTITLSPAYIDTLASGGYTIGVSAALNGTTSPISTGTFSVITNPTVSTVAPQYIEYQQAPSNGILISGTGFTAGGSSSATESVSVGGTTLTNQVQYTITDSVITLNQSYLNTLAAGQYIVTMTVSLNSVPSTVSTTIYVASPPVLSSFTPSGIEQGQSSSALALFGTGLTAQSAPGAVTSVIFTPSSGTAITVNEASLGSLNDTSLTVSGGAVGTFGGLETLAAGTYTVTVSVTLAGATVTSNGEQFIVGGTPTINLITPSAIESGENTVNVKVTGSGFEGLPAVGATSVVKVDGNVLQNGDYTLDSNTSLTIDDTFLAGLSVGSHSVGVEVTYQGQTAASALATLSVAAHPVITAASISEISQYETGTSLTIQGTGFLAGGLPGAVTNVSFTPLTGQALTISESSFASGSSDTAITLPDTVLDTLPAGTYTISVSVNLNGTIATASYAPFFIVNSAPALTLSEPGIEAGGALYALNIVGTSFLAGGPSGATVTFSRAAAAGIVVTSPNSISVPVSALDALSPGSYTVAVTIAVGSTTTTEVCNTPFIVAATPVLNTLSPSSIPIAGPSQSVLLTLTGSHFDSDGIAGANALVTFNSSATAAATIVNAGKLTIAVPSSISSVAGTYNVTITTNVAGSVSSPSDAVSLTVNAAPVITSISPAAVEYGSTWNGSLTINGSNLLDSDQGATSSISLSSLFGIGATGSATSITASSLNFPPLTVGTYNISVTVTDDGASATSAVPAVFTVAANPAIMAFSESAIEVNSASGSLGISGSGFLAGGAGGAVTTVTFSQVGGSAPITVTGLIAASDTSLSIPAAFLNSLMIGTYSVTVTVTLNGTSANASASSPFIVAGGPSVSSIFPMTSISSSAAPVSTPIQLSIEGTGFLGGGAATAATLSFTPVGGTLGVPVTVNSPADSSITSTIPAGILSSPGIYNVQVTSGTDISPISAADMLVVHPGIPASVSLSTRNSPMGGGAVSLTISPTNASDPGALVYDGILPNVYVLDANGNRITSLTPTAITDGNPTALNVTLPSNLLTSPTTYVLQVSYTAGSGQTSSSSNAPSATDTFVVKSNASGFTAVPAATITAGDSAASITLKGISAASLAGYNTLTITRNSDNVTFPQISLWSADSATSIYTLNSSTDTFVLQSDGSIVITVNADDIPFGSTNPLSTAGLLTLTLDNEMGTSEAAGTSYTGSAPFTDRPGFAPISGTLSVQSLDQEAQASDTTTSSNITLFVPGQLNLISIPGMYYASLTSGGSTGYDTTFTGSEIPVASALPLIFQYTDNNTASMTDASHSVFGYLNGVGTLAPLSGLSDPVSSPITYWNPVTQSYLAAADEFNFTNSIAVAAAAPVFPVVGQGYWSRIESTGSFAVHVINKGTNPAPGASCPILLHFGWNLVGDPFYTAAPLSTLTFSYSAGSETPTKTSFSGAVTAGLIGSVLYRYDSAESSQYIGVSPTASGSFNQSLQPFVGYWIFVGVDSLTLNAPDPGS